MASLWEIWIHTFFPSIAVFSFISSIFSISVTTVFSKKKQTTLLLLFCQKGIPLCYVEMLHHINYDENFST